MIIRRDWSVALHRAVFEHYIDFGQSPHNVGRCYDVVPLHKKPSTDIITPELDGHHRRTELLQHTLLGKLIPTRGAQHQHECCHNPPSATFTVHFPMLKVSESMVQRINTTG